MSWWRHCVRDGVAPPANELAWFYMGSDISHAAGVPEAVNTASRSLFREQGLRKEPETFCVQWHIFVLFLRFVFGLLFGWKIQTWPIIRFLIESVTCWFFICWYLKNPWCHVSKQDFQDLQQKYRPTTSKIQQYISLYTWGTFYPRVHQTHLECLLLKAHFFCFIWS